MVVWIPVIEPEHQKEKIGNIFLPAQETHVLPRVNEVVGFPDNEICKALKFEHRTSYLPRVTDIHHSIVGAKHEVWVFIRMNTYRTAEQTAELAKKNGINGWSSY
ncbi:MAG: hypothetical protein L0K41_08395 [Yaniella sp.]|nr:hypothetical protein [Yaniella sp.]MDN6498263.1 hypothetical protein [Yaniella sp.]